MTVYVVSQEDNRILEVVDHLSEVGLQEMANKFGVPVYAILGEHSGTHQKPQDVTKEIKHVFYQECECGCVENMLKFEYHDDLSYLWVNYYLPKQPFFKRLVNAVKYIFGYKSRYGDFGETVINDVEPLIEFLQDFSAHNEGDVETVDTENDFTSSVEAALNNLAKSMASFGGK